MSNDSITDLCGYEECDSRRVWTRGTGAWHSWVTGLQEGSLECLGILESGNLAIVSGVRSLQKTLLRVYLESDIRHRCHGMDSGGAEPAPAQRSPPPPRQDSLALAAAFLLELK